jgi:TIR domain
MSGKVFISYSRVNVLLAERLERDLLIADFDIWRDQHGILTGRNWDEAIEKELRASAAVIVILTQASVKSEAVRNEIAVAQSMNKWIFPVRFEPCEIPMVIARLHYTDLTYDYDAGLRQLVAALRQALNAATMAAIPIPAPRPPAESTAPVSAPKQATPFESTGHSIAPRPPAAPAPFPPVTTSQALPSATPTQAAPSPAAPKPAPAPPVAPPPSVQEGRPPQESTSGRRLAPIIAAAVVIALLAVAYIWHRAKAVPPMATTTADGTTLSSSEVPLVSRPDTATTARINTVTTATATSLKTAIKPTATAPPHHRTTTAGGSNHPSSSTAEPVSRAPVFVCEPEKLPTCCSQSLNPKACRDCKKKEGLHDEC